jgi:hypothetical protein
MRLLALLVLASWSLGCGDVPGALRRHTYPPDFQYIPRAEVESAMWALAREIHELDRVLRDDAMSPERRREVAGALLDAAELTTRELQLDGRRSNHPMLEAHFDQFRQDIIRARDAVRADPPAYFLAGAVSGACVYCHGGGG